MSPVQAMFSTGLPPGIDQDEPEELEIVPTIEETLNANAGEPVVTLEEKTNVKVKPEIVHESEEENHLHPCTEPSDPILASEEPSFFSSIVSKFKDVFSSEENDTFIIHEVVNLDPTTDPKTSPCKVICTGF